VNATAPVRFEAVVFDLDGTLVDSVGDIADALNAALYRSGLDRIDDETSVKRMVGRGSRRLVERALAVAGVAAEPEIVTSLLDAFLAAYRAAPCVRTSLYPGARGVLEGLRADGMRLGVCTNKPAEITDAILDRLAIGALFHSVVGGGQGLPLKPAPHMLERALAELGVAAGAAVMIGDGAADVGAGRAAGVPVILLAHGYSATPVGELGADALASGFEDLPRALAALQVQAVRP
jgi:phosphoglycolate phosphatase